MSGSPFLDALGADGAAVDRDSKMDLYGRFIGSWDLDVSQFRDDGTVRWPKGEWHFGWVLEGRAIQDVWIVPPRGELRHGDAAANVNSFGTTLRVYDPGIDAWHVQWNDPVTQSFLVMIGRAEGDEIVQLGTRADGHLVRCWRHHRRDGSVRSPVGAWDADELAAGRAAASAAATPTSPGGAG